MFVAKGVSAAKRTNLQGKDDHPFYEVYRALVRALVHGLRAGIGAALPSDSGPDYLGCAERMVRGGASPPRLLITHGVSGSGKSTVAQQLLSVTGAIRIRSDVERKRLFGLAALERSIDRARVYGPDATLRTFDRLAECARAALRAGYPVIIDAAFLRHAERDVLRALAAEVRVPFTILHCSANPVRLRERVAARSNSGDDASEADLEVLERQLGYAEPLSDDERALTIELSTDGPVDATALSGRWSAHAGSSLQLPPPG